jgi:hypothetical protein
MKKILFILFLIPVLSKGQNPVEKFIPHAFYQTVSFPNLTASLPMKLNASKQVVAAKILIGEADTTVGVGIIGWPRLAKIRDSLAALPGAPAGSDTHVQFNDGGALGGDAGLVYNKTTDVLTAGGAAIGDLTANTFIIATTGGRLTNSTLTTTTLTSFVSSNPSSSATVANLDDLTVVTNSLNYERNGSLVTFSVQFNVDPTLAATQTTFRFMLSVSSAFAASTNATGIGTCGTVAGLSASVTADATNDVLEVNFISVGTASFLMTITGQYRVI